MKLGIITGSLRQGRVTKHLADDIAKRVAQLDGVEVKQLDLMELNLPMFDEAISPKFNPDRQVSGSVKQWLDTLAEVDAVVVVSPEYNKSISGALKNAFDFIAHEVNHKPFAIAAHGSSRGAFAVAELRVIIPELGGISIPHYAGLSYSPYDSDGSYKGDASEKDALIDNLLAELRKYSDALVAVRK